MAQKALAQLVEIGGTLTQPAAHPQNQPPASPAAHPVADVVSEHGPAGGGGHHSERMELATAGHKAAEQGHGFTRQRQTGVLQEHRAEDHAVAPAHQPVAQGFKTRGKLKQARWQQHRVGTVQQPKSTLWPARPGRRWGSPLPAGARRHSQYRDQRWPVQSQRRKWSWLRRGPGQVKRGIARLGVSRVIGWASTVATCM